MSELQTRHTVPSTAPDAQERAPWRAGILLVDDQLGRLISYEAILAPLDVRCVRAQSGREALQRLLDEEFAVVLLDVRMPEMDGFEVARLIRGHPRIERTPIIFVTADTPNEVDRLRGYEAGAVDYINLPLVPEILRSKVAVLLELHQRRSDLQSLNRQLAQAEAQYEATVVEREALLRATFEHPTEMMILLDAERDETGRITDWIYRNANTRTLELLGLQREALIGQRLSAVLPERAEMLHPLCTHVLETREMRRYEAHFGGSDFLVTVFPLGGESIVSSALDITERKRAESALRESERRFRELANMIDQFAWVCDGTGYRTWYNDRWYQYCGATFAQMEGFGWKSLHHPQHVERVLAHLDECLHSGQPWEDTFPLRGRNGGYRWFLSRAMPIRDEHGHIMRWLGTNTDVTEQRELQEALERADRRKDEFLAMLAHELRNPVAPIASAAEVLTRVLQDDKPRRMADIIRRQAGQLGRLLDDLLDVARITQGRIELRRERGALQACVELAMETAEPLIRAKRHRLIVMLASTPLPVHVDRVRVAQCLTNLLSNAAKYTEPGGEIRIDCRAEGTDALIEVADTGIGIAAEFLPHMFELFAQSERGLDRAQGGRGIGLSVCKRLIEMHGGSVSARSAGAGRGATFTLRLPLASAVGASDTDTAPAPNTALRVLIVDDNDDAAQSLSLLLDIAGYRTLAVNSGKAALEVFGTFAPQVALLDIGLPDTSGYDVAQHLRARAPQVRLVAISGYGQPDDRGRSAAAGFDAHLVKPIDLDTLLHALR